MKLSPILTGEISLLLILRRGLNCVDDVPSFLIPNLHHFVKTFNGSWLSCSVDKTRDG